MTFHRLLIATTALVLLDARVGLSQTGREHVVSGGRSYYRLEQLLPDAPPYPTRFRLSVRPDGNTVVVYVADSVQAPRDVVLQVFDAWGRCVQGPLPIESIDEYDNSLAVLALADQTWVAWSKEDGSWLRRIDLTGETIAARQLLDDVVPFASAIFLATNGSLVAAEFGSDIAGPAGALARYYAPDGTPLSATFPVVIADGNHGYEQGYCAVAGDGTTLFTYDSFFPTDAAFYRVLQPGYPMGPPVPLTPPDWGSWVYATEDNDFIVCSLRGSAPTSAHAYRVALDGNVSATTVLPSDLHAVAGNSRGEFAAIFAPPGMPPSVQFYDGSFSATTTRIPFTNTPPNINPSHEGWPFSLALTPNGTFWAPWAIREASPVEFYLTMLKPFVPGDLDGDGRLTNFDIDPFVTALVDRASFSALYPAVPIEAVDIIGDMNGDSRLDNFDIDPFVEALVGGP